MDKKSSKPKDKSAKKTTDISTTSVFKNPLILVVSTAIVLVLIFFALVKFNVISINSNQTVATQTQNNNNDLANRPTEAENHENNEEQAKNSQNAQNNTKNPTQNTTQKPKNEPNNKNASAFNPKKPLPTFNVTPTKSSSNSQFVIPKDLINSPNKVGSDSIKKMTMQTYYAYYIGKAEDLSKNYPKNTLVFKTDKVEKDKAKDLWYTNHIMIIVPKSSVKIKLKDYDIYKITVAKDELNFEFTEKPSILEHNTYRIYSDSHGVAKTEYKALGTGILYPNFGSAIGDHYFYSFAYIKVPHKKRTTFGRTSSYYAFPYYLVSKYKLEPFKPYTVLSTGKLLWLDNDNYMFSGEIVVK